MLLNLISIISEGDNIKTFEEFLNEGKTSYLKLIVSEENFHFTKQQELSGDIHVMSTDKPSAVAFILKNGGSVELSAGSYKLGDYDVILDIRNIIKNGVDYLESMNKGVKVKSVKNNIKELIEKM